MCGLVGAIGKITHTHEAAVEQLLVVDQVRGYHSVGIAMVDTIGGVLVVKDTVAPNILTSSPEYTAATKYQLNLMMGHNRWATQGAVNAINAHPFEFGDKYKGVVGAHNGTLKGQHLLPDHQKFAVDSENIFHSINKDGIQTTVPKLWGAYALTWWDKERQSFNIVRNAERTLYTTYTEDKLTMFWASEIWMLIGILGRNKIKHGEVKLVPIDKHMEWQVPLNIQAKAQNVDNYLSVTDVTPYVPKVVSYGMYDYSSYFGAKDVDHGYLRGDIVNFIPEGASQAGGVYGYVCDNNGMDVYIYNAPDWLIEAANSNEFVAVAGDFNYHSRRNDRDTLFLDERTLVELDINDPSLEFTTIEGNKAIMQTVEGHDMSEQQFEMATKAGCNWCSSPMAYGLEHHVSTITGISLCCDCKTLEDVKAYM